EGVDDEQAQGVGSARRGQERCCLRRQPGPVLRDLAAPVRTQGHVEAAHRVAPAFRQRVEPDLEEDVQPPAVAPSEAPPGAQADPVGGPQVPHFSPSAPALLTRFCTSAGSISSAFAAASTSLLCSASAWRILSCFFHSWMLRYSVRSPIPSIR